jgi:hypothetical protein
MISKKGSISLNQKSMKIKAYRGTRLSSALQLLEGKMPNKTSYWITDKEESRPYANVEKWNDKDEK